MTFANKANLATRPLAVLTVNEAGHDFGGNVSIWTGTASGGTAASTCADWTSAAFANSGTFGSTEAGDGGWTASGTFNCNDSFRLLCIEQTNQPLAPTPPTTGKRLFVTSTIYPANLGPLAASDVRCTSAAQAANKGGTWKAWLSNSTETAASRQTDVWPRFQQLEDGGMVLTFFNKENLTTTPQSAIVVDERGRPTAGNYWTGTFPNGTLAWTSTSDLNLGTYGSGVTTPGWTSTDTIGCDNSLSLLCFEQ